MALKDTTKLMRDLLANITQDLEKADNGNKAASQRVRTGTVKLEKVAKAYRKESIKSEKQTKGHKKPAKKAAAPKAKAGAHKASAHKAHATKATAHKSSHKAAPKAKAAKSSAKTHKTTARPRALAVKRPTAKLPTKRLHAR